MNFFELFAQGDSFDPDAFLASTPLRFDGVWHKGDQGHEHPQSNGVRKSLGNGRAISWHEQQRIALDFLATHRDSLKALASFPGVTTFILGLQCQIKLDDCIVGTAMGLPIELLRQALDIGIEPTIYVVLDRESGRDLDEGQ